MKIYEVHYDNGESYEDAFDGAEKFFTTYEKALNYIKDMGLVEDSRFKGQWAFPKYVCKMNNIDCYECKYCDRSDNYNGNTFIDKYGEECDGCPEERDRIESEYDFSYYTIIERDVEE